METPTVAAGATVVNSLDQYLRASEVFHCVKLLLLLLYCLNETRALVESKRVKESLVKHKMFETDR